MASDNEDVIPLISQYQYQYEYSEFNYDEINCQDNSQKFAHTVEVDYGNKGKFISTAENDKFFVYLEMKNPPDDMKDHIDVMRKYGWKFHVSIDDTEPKNIEKGWNLVKEILIREHVYFSKVVAKGHQMENTEVLEKGMQRGKQITIYTVQHLDRGLDRWGKLVSEITRVLAENEITPSYRPEADELIEGSNYVSFRSDGYYSDKYSENVEFNRVEDWRVQIEQIHPGELAEFRAGIQIDPPVPNQISNPIWEPPSSISKCCPM